MVAVLAHISMTIDDTDMDGSRSGPLLPPSGDPLQLLAQLANLGAAIEREMKRQFDLTRGEYEILTILERAPIPQKNLCARTRSTAAAVSRWLMRLDREGWVTRQHPDNNQRDLVSHLSRRGLNQLRRIRTHMAEALRPMADALTPAEEQVLLRLEKNMTRMLSQTSIADDVNTAE